MNKEKIIQNLDIKNYFNSEFSDIKWNGSGWGQTSCNKHEDKNPSLFINEKTGHLHCKGCGYKASIFDYYIEKHEIDFKTTIQELSRLAGINPEPQKKIIKAYDYTDEEGRLLFQTVRYEPKDFKQRRPDPNNPGKWIYNLQGVQLIPYNLPDVLKAESIIIVEGEKDVERLKSIGFVASCSPLGANKWKPEYNQYFKGKKVAIIPDNDTPGRNHALQVAKNLKGTAESLKIIELPDLKEKQDITDWLQAGGTKDKLLEIIQGTPEWIPEEPKSIYQKHHRDNSKERFKVSPLYSLNFKPMDVMLKWNDILSLNVTTEYILDKLIPNGSITLLFGRGGIGKTSVCLQIAKAIAEGVNFAELPTIKTSVYFIDFENPLSVLKERATHIGTTDNLWVWHISNDPMPPRLDALGWEVYKELPPGLIIFDTLRASHLSDENNSQDMAIIISRLKELRELGFTVLLLHHTPKGNENIYKGSTALLDLVDHVLSIEGVKDTDNEPIEFDTDNLYRLGVRIKTRYEPHHIFLRFNPTVKGFEIAKDPDYEIIEEIHSLLENKDELNTNQVYELVKKELDIKNKAQVIRLLKKGNGKYWTTEKRGRAVFYRFQSLDIYKAKLLNHSNGNGLKPSDSITSQGINNSIEFNSLDSAETIKPSDLDGVPKSNRIIGQPIYTHPINQLDVIDLTNTDFEVVE